MGLARIGIVGWSVDDFFGASKQYLNYLSQFGRVEIITPSKKLNCFDLVILPGGPDISPTKYNKVPEYFTGKQCPFREFFDNYHLPKLVEKKVPIFGICRGMQYIWTYFSGDLWQHLDFHPQSTNGRGELVHPVDFHPPYDKAFKDFSFCSSKEKGVWVNSLHHQGAKFSSTPDCLNVIAITRITKNHKKCRIVEAFRHKTLPIAGVQFHPEENNHPLSNILIKELLGRKELKIEEKENGNGNTEESQTSNSNADPLP